MKQSNSPSGRSIINLQPIAPDYMRLTMAYMSESGTDYNAISSRRDFVNIQRSKNLQQEFNTSRPKSTKKETPKKMISQRPKNNKLLDMDIEQILEKNKQMNMMYKSGVSLYSVEPTQRGYQQKPQDVKLPEHYKIPQQIPQQQEDFQQFSQKTISKIEMLNKEQQTKAMMDFRGTYQNVTYKNLEVRDDLQSTMGKSFAENKAMGKSFIQNEPGTGPRFSNNLLAKSGKSRSPSPEVLGGSHYLQYLANPGYEPPSYVPYNQFDQQKPSRVPPNENILKIDNFIKNLLSIDKDPQMKEMLFGSLKKEKSPPRFKQFIQNYDAQVSSELRQMRGLSPEENAQRIERAKALQQIDTMIQTIKSQDKKLPEYLRQSMKQREQFELLNESRIPTKDANATNTMILSNGFDMKDLIPRNITDLKDKPEVGRYVADEKNQSPNRFSNVQNTSFQESNTKTIKISQKGFLTRNNKFKTDQVPESRKIVDEKNEPLSQDFEREEPQPDEMGPEEIINKIDTFLEGSQVPDVSKFEPEEQKPQDSPKAIREYQIFENFEDLDFYTDNANFEKIIEDLNKQDKYLNMSITSKKSAIQVIEQLKKEKIHLDESLKNDKSLNIDPDEILKKNLNNHTIVQQDLKVCFEQKQILEESQQEIQKEIQFDGNKTTILSDKQQTSAFSESRAQRQLIEMSFEQQKIRNLEQEIQMKEKIMENREKERAEEKKRAEEMEQEMKKNEENKSKYSNYKIPKPAEMSDELRIQSVFTDKLLKILYTF